MVQAIATHAHWAGPSLAALVLVQALALLAAERTLDGMDLLTFRRTLRPVLSATCMAAVVLGCLWAWGRLAA